MGGSIQAVFLHANVRFAFGPLRWRGVTTAGGSRAHGIRVVDCANPHALDPAYQVQGYGRPGREVHAGWADCIAPALESLRVTDRAETGTAAPRAAR